MENEWIFFRITDLLSLSYRYIFYIRTIVLTNCIYYIGRQLLKLDINKLVIYNIIICYTIVL